MLMVTISNNSLAITEYSCLPQKRFANVLVNGQYVLL